MACSPYTPCGSTITGNSAINNMNIETLNGDEGNLVIKDAISNQDVLSLGQQMEKQGYHQQLMQASPTKITLSNDTMTTTIQYVVIPINTGKKDLDGNTIYVKSGNNVNVVTQLNGTGKHFPHIMSILASNDSYQKVKSDIEKEGYTVNENDALVTEAIGVNSDYALVTLKANNDTSSKYAYALIDVKNNKVVSVSDFNTLCALCIFMADAVMGIGSGLACFATLMALCVPTIVGGPLVVACLGFIGVICAGVGILTGTVTAVAFCRDTVHVC
jgi:hypothetical protein